MPTYRLAPPGEPPELLEADSCRVESIHTVLRGTALVMGLPREVVVRRAPASVLVELVEWHRRAGRAAELGAQSAAPGRPLRWPGP